MNRKNFLKNKKINWIKVVIQILSFALIPGLFEGEFAAVGNIVSCIYKGNISWESVKYSVWMLVEMCIRDRRFRVLRLQKVTVRN